MSKGVRKDESHRQSSAVGSENRTGNNNLCRSDRVQAPHGALEDLSF